MSLTPAKRNKISETILALVKERGPDKTICPSDVARSCFAEDWRESMDDVRQVAQNLIEQGLIEAIQKGRVISSAIDAHGPIRLRQRHSAR